MSQFTSITRSRGSLVRSFFASLCAAGLLSIAAVAYCDEPVSMAPPIQSSVAAYEPSNAADSSVFNWHEIPENQNVPIRRATFDKGGYQLYDTVGETIVVPFTNDNLYVMKFAVSPDGSTYFVNTGTEPVLYLPQNGYLVNASDPTGRWHPFTQHWHPSTPVFVGIAPSWNDYVGMGWYPGMACYGGYWCSQPFLSVGVVFPAFGLFFDIGGSPFWGWGPYWNYCGFHPAPFHMGIYNSNFYRWGGRGWRNYAGFNHPFNGTGRSYVYGHGYVANGGRGVGGRSFGGGRTFMGAGRPYVVGHGFVGGARSANGSRGAMAHQQFRGSAASASHESGRSFRGAGSSGAFSHTTSHSFRGASGSHLAGSSRSFGAASGRSFGGGGGGRSFGGGGGGGRSFGGGGGGGRSFGGGGGHGGGGDHHH